MKIELTKPFVKDLKKLSKEAQTDVALLIKKIEAATDLDTFDVKRLKGFKNNFRIRLGIYRIGYFTEGDTIVCSRVAKRDEIYKIFP